MLRLQAEEEALVICLVQRRERCVLWGLRKGDDDVVDAGSRANKQSDDSEEDEEQVLPESDIERTESIRPVDTNLHDCRECNPECR